MIELFWVMSWVAAVVIACLFSIYKASRMLGPYDEPVLIPHLCLLCTALITPFVWITIVGGVVLLASPQHP